MSTEEEIRQVTVSEEQARKFGLNLLFPPDRIIAGLWADMQEKPALKAAFSSMSEEELIFMVGEWRDFARNESTGLRDAIRASMSERVTNAVKAALGVQG